MRTNRIMIQWAFVLFAVIGFNPRAAFSYVPPSQFIVKNLAAKHMGVKDLRVRSGVVGLDGEKPNGVKFKEVFYYHPQNQTFKSWALNDADQVLFVSEGKIHELPLPTRILVDPHYKALVTALKDGGVPVRSEDELLAMKDEDERRSSERLSLKRWNGKFAWVMGGKEKSSPQLWVEKDSFLPLRWVGPGNVDARFDGFRQYKGLPLPQTVSLIRDDVSVLRVEVQEVSVDQDAFKLPKSGHTIGWTEIGSQASSSVRELIRRFYGVIR